MWLIVIALFVSGKANAQSISWVKEGTEIMKKVSETEYSMPQSLITYQLENGALWQLNSNKRFEKPSGYVKTMPSGRIFFYGQWNEMLGYYVPAEKRYYYATGKGETIEKESAFAVVQDGKIYTTGANDGSPRYTVDDAISPIWIGFFLFII
jgi:hypothetical protein